MKTRMSVRDELALVHGEIVSRLSGDNANSWQIVQLSSLLLTALSALLALAHSDRLLVRLFLLLAALSFTLAILSALLSIVVQRDLTRIPKFMRLRLLGSRGEHARDMNEKLESKPEFKAIWNRSLFHTAAFIDRSKAEEWEVAFERYLHDVRASFELDFARYLFFLANLIETKKSPRSWALRFTLLGAMCIMVSIGALVLPGLLA